MFILDSNIVIYSIKKNKNILSQLRKLALKPCLLSVITRLEVLLGAEKEQQPVSKVKEAVDVYPALPIDTQLVDKAFQMKHDDGVSLKFKDLLIAATALEHDLTLVTADKAFKKIKNLKLKFIAI